MPVSKRTGSRYAAGSAATWSPGDSRICAVCGQRLRITVDAMQLHTDARTGAHTSWHLPRGSCVGERA